jgi:2-phospho-L-lactate guanylyltransferase
MTANWWVVVPMRGINSGKSRLTPVLDAQGRVTLNRWLLAHTLDVIEHWRGDLERCLVVSPCDEVLKLARAAGAIALREAGGGLNAALAFAAAQAAARGAEKLLIVACDLPDLNAAALAAITNLAKEKRCAALAPDRAGTGTNALAFDADVAHIFEFGADSCRRHLAAFACSGHRGVLCERAEFAFDLDTPQDHAEWTVRRDARIRRRTVQSGQKQIQISEAGK